MPTDTAIAACLNSGESLADRILKVNHAGEHGAVNIYRGQALICRWRAPSLLAELEEFRRHEEGHRAGFTAEMERRGVRRCRSYHLCGIGGLALGILTGLCGKAAVAATTVAVESVVLRHLEEQMAYLETADEDAYRAVRTIVEEERAHHDRAAASVAPRGFWWRLVLPTVTLSTEAVIWLGMRL
ncbi:MAG: demethoxyubiquinone hydroxylase family protein [Inquilinus sp.]|nr:demethoxyubiquinone hydroxylase family protein [Inquilinus sp.]